MSRYRDAWVRLAAVEREWDTASKQIDAIVAEIDDKQCDRCGHPKWDHGDALLGFRCPNECEKSCPAFVPKKKVES